MRKLRSIKMGILYAQSALVRRTRSACNATSEPLPAVEPVADERPFPRGPTDVCLEVGGLAVHLRTVGVIDSG